MVPRPEVFISAGAELSACRKAIKQALLEMGVRPVEMQDFTIEYGLLHGVLAQMIGRCDAVIHVAGPRYGIEPMERTLGAPRRSFPHYELDVAQALGKPIFYYLTASTFPVEPCPPEDPARQELQREHRAAIERGGTAFLSVASPEELGRRIRELRNKLLVRQRAACLPPRLPGGFVGRDRLLASLQDKLASGQVIALHPPVDAPLRGGWGATTAAIEVAWRLHEEGRYDYVFHIPAGPRADMEAAFAAITRRDALALLPDEVAGHRVRFDAVTLWLRDEANAGRWLVLIDGVDHEVTWGSVLGFLPMLQRGSVLVTGRISHWRGAHHAFHVNPLAADQARELLAKNVAMPRPATYTERTILEQIGEHLDRHPLTLALAASLLRETKQPLHDFLAGCSAGRGNAMSLPLVLRKLAALLTAAERALFRLLLCLAPQPAAIPVTIFERRSDWPQNRAALGRLQQLGLVGFDEASQSILIHRLVREIGRDILSAGDVASALGAARAVVDGALPRSSDSAAGGVMRELLVPHCRALLGQLNGHPLEAHAGQIAQTLAHWLKDWGRPHDAEPFYRRALAIEERNFGPDRPEVAARLRDLGATLRAVGRAREAEELYRRALQIVEKECGANAPETAAAIEQLAGCLRATNRLAEAEPLYRRALSIQERLHGRSHPKTAIGLHQLGALLESARRPHEAVPLFQRALEIDERTFGEGHPRIASRVYHLASALHGARKLAEAETLYRRAIELDERKLGMDHPDIAPALRDFAFLLEETWRADEAEALYRRVLAIHEQALGPEHCEVAMDLTNLAGLLQDRGALAEAEPLFLRALQIIASLGRHLHREHPHFHTAARNYSGVLHAQGLAEDEIAARIRAVAPEPPRKGRAALWQ